MTNCNCEIEIKNNEQIRVLIILMGINAFMFFIEMGFGILSDSTALIADSLDMLADATVYGISLYAVGRTTLLKIKAAHISGILQIVLGAGVCLEILRRLIWGSEPESLLIITIGAIALIANIICLLLISKHKNKEVHMRASWIFSRNDVIANLGVIISGGLVYFLNSRLPDLIIGMLMSVIIIRGGVYIIKDARNEKQAQTRLNLDN